MGKRKTNNPTIDAARGAAAGTTARTLDTVRAAREGAQRVRQVADQWAKASPEQLAGRLAEELHAATFNADAAARGLQGLRATTGAASGSATAAADVTITRAGRVVDQAQVKYHATPQATTFEVARARYDGMQRVVPADQVEAVRDLAARRGADGLGVRNYPETAARTSDRIRHGGAESRPLTRQEALEVARNPKEAADRLVRGKVAGAVRQGAIAGAAVGGGISLVSNVVAYANDRKSGEEAVVDTLKDTAACAASGAVVSGATVVAETALVRAGASTLARSSAPIAIGLTTVDVVKDAGRLVTGDIDGEEFAVRTAKHAATGVTTWGGMEVGAAIGTAICPGVGTVIGGLLGGVGGGLFGGWLFG